MKTYKWALSTIALATFMALGAVLLNTPATATTAPVVAGVDVSGTSATVRIDGGYNHLYYYLWEDGSKRFVSSGFLEGDIDVEKNKTYYITATGWTGSEWSVWSEWYRFKTLTPPEAPLPPNTETPSGENTDTSTTTPTDTQPAVDDMASQLPRPTGLFVAANGGGDRVNISWSPTSAADAVYEIYLCYDATACRTIRQENAEPLSVSTTGNIAQFKVRMRLLPKQGNPNTASQWTQWVWAQTTS